MPSTGQTNSQPDTGTEKQPKTGAKTEPKPGASQKTNVRQHTKGIE
ncbi:MAG: hypothetical protein Q8865_01425 [Bacillota bacterium]|nr:hypothetical protein [Bacillota bacterium]